jgi:D-amino-acid dehydrogenase
VTVKKVVVVGAGIVGLSCAWSLQDHGVEVDVLDRAREGAGASSGNAGYLSPAHATPLPSPAVLRYGMRAVFSRRSPVVVPWRGGPGRTRFLLELIRHCTAASWQRSMEIYRVLNQQAIDAFDEQRAGGVEADTTRADVLTGFTDASEARSVLEELIGVVHSGQAADVSLLTGTELRQLEPCVTAEVRSGLLLRGQRYLAPRQYVSSLAKSLRERGGRLTGNTPVVEAGRTAAGVYVRAASGERFDADAVVLANGAWLGALAAAHGVTTPVHAGRGYSFTLPIAEVLRHPIHFPSKRLALAPDGDRVRVTGMMEFGDPDAPPSPRRLESMSSALRPLLSGLDWNRRADDWVGPRPLSSDGLPLVGRAATAGVYVAGGHGMWGMTLGPVTGRLLARQIVTGETPPELKPLDPLRQTRPALVQRIVGS